MTGLAERPARSLAAPAFDVADLRDLMTRDIPQPAFVIERIVPSLAVTLLGGHGGTGKSIVGLTLAAHVAANRSWAGLIVQGGRAVFLSLEDPASLVLHRLKRIITAYDLPPASVLANLIVLDGSNADAALMRESVEGGRRELHETKALRELRERVDDVALIVVDNASDGYDGSENERRMVRHFVRVLAQFARERNGAVVLLAHVDKNAAKQANAGQNYSGSTAWHNSARSRIALLASNRDVELVHEKCNLGHTAEPILLQWTAHGVLVPTTNASAPEATELDADAEAVLEALKEAHALGVIVPAARTGPSTAHKVLETGNALPKHLRGQAGREKFWSAMTRLLASKSASSVTYRNADSKERTRIVVAETAGFDFARQSPIPPTELAEREPTPSASSRQSAIGGEPAEIGGADEEVITV